MAHDGPRRESATGSDRVKGIRCGCHDQHDKNSYFFCDCYREAWGPALRQLILARFDAEVADVGEAQQAHPRPPVVVKEPGLHVADLLMTLFPESRMIFLLRDGRDVVDSWLAAYRRGSWALDEGAFAVTDAGREALVRWQSAVWAFRTAVVQRVYDEQPPDRRVLVRYEALVVDPARELARICAQLRLDASADALGAVASRHAYAAVPRAAKGDDKEIRWRRPAVGATTSPRPNTT